MTMVMQCVKLDGERKIVVPSYTPFIWSSMVVTYQGRRLTRGTDYNYIGGVVPGPHDTFGSMTATALQLSIHVEPGSVLTLMYEMSESGILSDDEVIAYRDTMRHYEGMITDVPLNLVNRPAEFKPKRVTRVSHASRAKG